MKGFLLSFAGFLFIVETVCVKEYIQLLIGKCGCSKLRNNWPEAWKITNDSMGMTGAHACF